MLHKRASLMNPFTPGWEPVFTLGVREKVGGKGRG